MINIFKHSISTILVITSLFFSAQNQNDMSGSYFLKKGGKLYQALSDVNYQKIILNKDNTYILYHAPTDFFEQCNYASKGSWKQIGKEVIDLTSENFYTKQEGYKYEIKQEKKLSKDSVYINMELHSDFENRIPTPEFSILFNYNTRKLIETINKNIKISKKEYSLLNMQNKINIDLYFRAYGKMLYTNRLVYSILKDFPIDTEKYNYFTIKLPYFDQCFYGFEPYNHSYMYIKDENTLIWQGQEWIKEK
ncbi:hypothetical protein M2347_004199 [Chryseobacterium sp. H1D6B]|uniref:hypothetical protein n=1 Tax=Chryseobacterium sp. H1D6B TaxID=2940588 RepID=UPI0015CAED69|nr:hypothetical protein [Chryseobacterium sp. H1D6B]MDH6254472.1 hypothetical protein [Chryseobacterium sp. H1D6B]